jgi:hypothetical protein
MGSLWSERAGPKDDSAWIYMNLGKLKVPLERASRPLCIIEQWSSIVVVNVDDQVIYLFTCFTLEP